MEKKKTIVVASSFTAEPIKDAIHFWLERLEIAADIVFAPQSQVFQTLLESGSCFNDNSDLNVVLVRWQDFDTGAPRFEFSLTEFFDILRASAARTKITHLVLSCPNLTSLESTEKQQRYRDWDQQLNEEFSDDCNVIVVTADQLQTLYRPSTIYDVYGDRFAAIPFSPATYATLGTVIARNFHTITNEPYKVIIVDCDDTLWSGVCGEDGPRGVGFEPSHLMLHKFLLSLAARGFLIGLCSRNNPEDIAAVFQERSELLQLAKVVQCQRINWQSKAENLLSIAKELGFGTDSFIFLDDNPVECEAMRLELPSVLTLKVPHNSSQVIEWLQRVWAFDRPKITDEDRKRTLMYAQSRERENLRQSSKSLEQFIAGLELKITRVPLDNINLSRASQLTFRVNQFNLTTIRRTEAELNALMGQSGRDGVLIEVTDRFGEYGLVGLVLYTETKDRLIVDTFLLSCRALGRGVEHHVVAALAKLAQGLGKKIVSMSFIPTAKNQPAHSFLRTCFPIYEMNCETHLEYNVPVAEAMELRYRPTLSKAALDMEKESEGYTSATPLLASNRTREIERFAEELSDADSILSAIQNWRRKDNDLTEDFLAPRTQTEQVLADMWKEVLGLERVGVHDNFFTLGGDSLKMVRIMINLFGQMGIEFPIADFFGNPTIEAHAAKIDAIKHS